MKVESTRGIGFNVRGLSYFVVERSESGSPLDTSTSPFGFVALANHYIGFSVLTTFLSDFPTLASAMSKFPTSATARFSEVMTIFGVVITFLAHLAIQAKWSDQN